MTTTIKCALCGRKKEGADYRDDLIWDLCTACQSKPPNSLSDLTPEEKRRLLNTLDVNIVVGLVEER